MSELKERIEKWIYECFVNDVYHNQWRVRKQGELHINQGIQVDTRKEAEFLVEQLNKVEDQAARIEELEAENQRLREALEFIEFGSHVRCDTYKGKSCDANTQEAYEEHLSMISDAATRALAKD